MCQCGFCVFCSLAGLSCCSSDLIPTCFFCVKSQLTFGGTRRDKQSACSKVGWYPGRLRKTSTKMEDCPFEDIFPIEDGNLLLLCWFTGGVTYDE